MTQTLLTLFPNPEDLLSLEPEDLGGVILELAPGVMQNGMFTLSALEQPAAWYRPTRRAQHIKTRTDVERFRKGRLLPTELLQPAITQKIFASHLLAIVEQR